MIAATDRHKKILRDATTWAAMALLLVGWLHASLHYAEAGHEGHFGADLETPCQLAEIPVLALAEGPTIGELYAATGHQASSTVGATENCRANTPPIRAPPAL